MSKEAKDYKSFVIDMERGRVEKERWTRFEHSLSFLSSGLTNVDDLFLINEIQHAAIVFAMADRFGEDSPVFLENTKVEFYASIRKLEGRHPELSGKLDRIRLFIEDYYLNCGEKISEQEISM